MKKKYQILIFCAGIGMTACENTPANMNDIAEYASIYMKQAVEYPNRQSLEITDKEQQIIFNACYGGYVTNEQQIKVEFELEPGLVDEFNEKNNTNYKPLPIGSYQLSEKEASILPGKLNTSSIQVSLYTKGHINAGESYLLPVSIRSVDNTIPVNEDLRTTYFLITGNYPLGEEPPKKAFDLNGKNLTSLFTFNNFLSVFESNGVVILYPYESSIDGFNTMGNSPNTGWNIFDTLMPYDGSFIARWGDGTGRLWRYPVDVNGNITPATEIGSGFQMFDLIVSSLYHHSLFCRKPDGELLCYPYSGTWGNVTSLGTGWDAYSQILTYRKDILALDSSGDLWLFPVDDQRNVGERQKVGRGWNKYSRILSFGTDLLALDNDGILWQYKFDIRGFWDVTTK